MAKSNTMILVVGGVGLAAAGYYLYRRNSPVVDVEIEKKGSALTSASKAACMAAAIASGVPAPLADMTCGVSGALIKGAGAAAKAVGKGIAKGAKAVGRGVKKGTIAVVKAPVRATKFVGKKAVKGAKAVVRAPVKVAKFAGKKVVKAGKKIGQAGKAVAKAPVKAVKKVGKWLGLGDADMDLAAYALSGLQSGRTVKRRTLARQHPPRIIGLGCAGGEDCCESLRGQMRGHAFYDRGLASYQGL